MATTTFLDENALVVKDPASIEPYGFDWSDWLAGLGGSPTPVLSTSSYRVRGKDTALESFDASIVTGSERTQAKFRGGTWGQRYKVTNRVTATDGSQDERSFTFSVGQR